MKEGNNPKSRKRKYRCVKRPEIKDTEQGNDSSESTSSSVSEREYNDATKRVASWIMSILKSEDENMEMEEDNISGDEDMPRCAYFCKNCNIIGTFRTYH